MPNTDFIYEAQEEESFEILDKTNMKSMVAGPSVDEIFKGRLSEVGLDLLNRMLRFNPNERISVEDALAHEFFAGLHNEEDEPTCDIIDQFDFDFEVYDLEKSELKQLIYEEIMLYHDEEQV